MSVLESKCGKRLDFPYGYYLELVIEQHGHIWVPPLQVMPSYLFYELYRDHNWKPIHIKPVKKRELGTEWYNLLKAYFEDLKRGQKAWMMVIDELKAKDFNELDIAQFLNELSILQAEEKLKKAKACHLD